MSEVNEASTLIESAAHEDANIIFGAVLDETMGNEVKITVIATGFRQEHPRSGAKVAEQAPFPACAWSASPPFPGLPAKTKTRIQARSFTRTPNGSSMSTPPPFSPNPCFLSLRRSLAAGFVDEAQRSAPASPPAPGIVIGSAVFDEPFEEEYARIVPNPESRNAQAGSGTMEDDSQHDNLDIPAFLRKGNR